MNCELKGSPAAFNHADSVVIEIQHGARITRHVLKQRQRSHNSNALKEAASNAGKEAQSPPTGGIA